MGGLVYDKYLILPNYFLLLLNHQLLFLIFDKIRFNSEVFLFFHNFLSFFFNINIRVSQDSALSFILYIIFIIIFFYNQQFITQSMVADHGSYFVTMYRWTESTWRKRKEKEKKSERNRWRGKTWKAILTRCYLARLKRKGSQISF